MAEESTKADIYLYEGKAGLLEKTERGYRFTYYPDYLSSKYPQPVSLTLPLSEEPYESENLFPFFLGLIPEGWLLDITSRTLKIDPENTFDILLETCGDCVGAVSVVPIKEGEET